MVLDAALLNTQHYKVMIKGKVEQSLEWSRALPYTLGIVAIEKVVFGSPSTEVNNFALLIVYLQSPIVNSFFTQYNCFKHLQLYCVHIWYIRSEYLKLYFYLQIITIRW